MADIQEQGPLNDSIYGPSAPSWKDPRRKLAGIEFGSRGCAPYSLLCGIFRSITIVLIMAAIIVVFIWLIYQPQALKVHVEDATLYRFHLAGTNQTTLFFFDLAANVSLHNPNEKYDLYYEHLEADAYYDGFRLSYLLLPKMRQRHNNTTVVQLRFQGQAAAGDTAAAATYEREMKEGFFSISLKFYTKIRLKLAVVKSARHSPEVDCDVRLPVPGNETSAEEGFVRTGCRADDFS